MGGPVEAAPLVGVGILIGPPSALLARTSSSEATLPKRSSAGEHEPGPHVGLERRQLIRGDRTAGNPKIPYDRERLNPPNILAFTHRARPVTKTPGLFVIRTIAAGVKVSVGVVHKTLTQAQPEAQRDQ
jgi:hypothetical protein